VIRATDTRLAAGIADISVKSTRKAVCYQSKDGEEERAIDALEWLVRHGGCSYIPNKGEQMVGHNGLYSQGSRRKRGQENQDEWAGLGQRWGEAKEVLDDPPNLLTAKGEEIPRFGGEVYACSAVACRRRPSALMTLSTVANSGLPSGDSAL